ncbi:hypothetical protein F5Y18DRAFT_21027 [Xylariaceae sp. FL1019]|nr:hypothetical protein F5Y18DRAFT_21027 [Xylariaceae sp. FL1019]
MCSARPGDLWWGEKFRGVKFYYLTGFHFAFLESKAKIAHMQFWIAGSGASAGAHNHSNDMFQEIHISLSFGTESGGMSKIRPQYAEKTADEAEALPPSASSTGRSSIKTRMARPCEGAIVLCLIRGISGRLAMGRTWISGLHWSSTPMWSCERTERSGQSISLA